MKIDDFFSFRSKYVSSTFQVSAEGLKDESGLHDEYKLITANYNNIQFPVIFKQEDGKILRDILDTGWPNLFLISDHLKYVLENNDLTGWKTFPIKIYDKKQNEIFGYHGFSVIGRCGPADYKNAKIIDKRRVPDGPISKYYLGYPVGLDQWDGTDFFLPEESYGIIITNKAAKILKENKITNLDLTNLADIEIRVDSI